MCLLYAYEKNKVISCRLSKSRLEEIRIAPMRDESKKYLIQLHKLRPRQNGRHFADDIFICIFLNENIWIAIKISTKFVPEGPINNIPPLVQIMAWRRIGDKPLSEAMVVEFANAYMRHSASVTKKAIREVKLSYLPRMRYAESVNLEVWLKNVCNFRTKSSNWWPFLLNFSSGNATGPRYWGPMVLVLISVSSVDKPLPKTKWVNIKSSTQTNAAIYKDHWVAVLYFSIHCQLHKKHNSEIHQINATRKKEYLDMQTR